MQDREAVHDTRAALGAELAAYRRAAGCTQARLAQLTGYSRSTIANVETGRQHVPRRFWEDADAALRTGGTLATASDEVETAARRDLRAAARQVSIVRQARAWSHDLNADADPGLSDKEPGDTQSAQAPWWPAELSIPADRAASPGPTGERDAAGRPRQVTPGDVIRLRGMRAHLKAIDNAHGGGAALPMATWYLHQELRPLMYARDGDPAARALMGSWPR